MDTTLDIYQWFKVENIHYYLYCAKVDSNSYQRVPVGQQIAKIMKIIMGWLLMILILLLIFGPMIYFSGLNPRLKPNNITNASFSIGV